MPWFKVDDQLHSHPKTRRAGLEAMGLWVASGSYCMSYKTDGFVPQWFVCGWRNGRKLAETLHSSGYWEGAVKNGEDGWQFHDWEHYQPLSDEIEADREAARIRQAERRKRLREAKNKVNGHAPVTANVTPPVTRDIQRDMSSDVQRESQDPVPSRPVRLLKDLREFSRFEEFWTVYPIKRGKKEAQGAYEKLVKAGVDQDRIIAGAKVYAEYQRKPGAPATKYAQGWLNGERWTDEIDLTATPNGREVQPVPSYDTPVAPDREALAW